MSEQTLHKNVETAALKVEIVKSASCHTWRHSFATRLLEANHDMRAAAVTWRKD